MVAKYLRCDVCDKAEFPVAASDYGSTKYPRGHITPSVDDMEHDAQKLGWRIVLGPNRRGIATRTHVCPECFTKPISLKEFCKRMGWGYPLPAPGTIEAAAFISERLPDR